MKTASHLAGSVGELVAQCAIRSGNTGIDRGPGRWRLQAGLKPNVLQERRFGEVSLHDVAGAMNTRPPADKVQQIVRVKAQTPDGQPAYVLAVQIAINPANLPIGSLLDYANWTLCGVGGLQINHAELH